MIRAQTSSGLAPLTVPVVAMAPGLTKGFISLPRSFSTATMELNTWPVASTPTASSTVCSPDCWNTSAMVNTLEIDWIENSGWMSPAVESLPRGVTTATPK